MRLIEVITTLQNRGDAADNGVDFSTDSLTSAYRLGRASAYADAVDLLKTFPLMLDDETVGNSLDREWRELNAGI